ncbi:hypothetical protein PUN28_020720 [Cardiocondyla obscurior]|uniref:Uncharacterized protein n=1 Tax=Cardiocondyla obscurior TaxID=286306 RepID=A0AAW2E8Q4_9HYME
MHSGLFQALYIHQKPRYGQKTKIFLNLLSIFTSSRDMAKKRKKYFKIWQHDIVRHLKEMHTGLFRAFYFHQHAFGPIPSPLYSSEAEIWPKTKKIFLKFCNIALWHSIDAFWAYSELLYSSEAEIWPKNKKYF